MKNIAAIDMGTNSFHLLIVEVLENEQFNFLDREREVIRLGSHLGEDLSIISEGEIEKAIDILKNFKGLAEYYNAEIHAVTTSAVREAKNREEFLNAIHKETGIIVDVIDGRKEAELIYSGAKKALRIKNEKVFCIDIGGGSSEFILAKDEDRLFVESIKIGAVRLTKKFFHDYIITDDTVKSCSEYIDQQLKNNGNLIFNQDFDLAVGTSGTVNSVAFVLQQQKYGRIKKSINKFTFNKQDLDFVSELILNSKTPADRKLIPGMEAKRADIIPAGILILKKAFELFNIKEMMISEYALREGIVLNALRE